MRLFTQPNVAHECKLNSILFRYIETYWLQSFTLVLSSAAHWSKHSLCFIWASAQQIRVEQDQMKQSFYRYEPKLKPDQCSEWRMQLSTFYVKSFVVKERLRKTMRMCISFRTESGGDHDSFHVEIRDNFVPDCTVWMGSFSWVLFIFVFTKSQVKGERVEFEEFNFCSVSKGAKWKWRPSTQNFKDFHLCSLRKRRKWRVTTHSTDSHPLCHNTEATREEAKIKENRPSG